MILVIAEQRDGKLNRASWESIAGAQQIGAAASGEPIVVAIPGASVDSVASELAAASVAEIVTLDSVVLASYTADGFTAALQAAIAELSPSLVVLPHTYQTRDFAPKLAARLDRAIITDVTGVKSESGRAVFVRPMFQGKLTADVAAEGPTPHFVTFQIGAFRPDQAERSPNETRICNRSVVRAAAIGVGFLAIVGYR